MKFYTQQEYNKVKPKDKGVKQCPFCKDEEMWKNDEYYVRNNECRIIFYPAKPSGGVNRHEKHLLLIPKKHHINSPTLSHEEILSKQEAEKWIEQYFHDKQYISYMRHTDKIKSIQHVHYHYMEGDLLYTDINNSLLSYDKENAEQPSNAK